VKVASVGNPGLHLATWVGGFPGMSAMVTHQLGKRMEELDFPSIPEFLELIHDTGAGLYACQASVDMFELTRDDFIDEEEWTVAYDGLPALFGLAFLFTDQLQQILAGVHQVERWVPILLLLGVAVWIGVRAYRRSGALEPETSAGREEAAC